ncbi:hypothetical protein CHS0354_012542, partial [Potamilus streckersoni]
KRQDIPRLIQDVPDSRKENVPVTVHRKSAPVKLEGSQNKVAGLGTKLLKEASGDNCQLG